jgi:hypothetical protein
MTDDEIRDRDKRLTAAHEAGHFVVSVYIGQFIRAKLEESGAADLSSDRAWVGEVEIEDGDWTPAMVIAGEVAVAFVEEPEYWNDTEGLVEYMLEEIRDDPNYLSATDREAFSDDPQQQQAAIVEAAAILHNNRALFEWASKELYSRGEVDFSRPALACEFENSNGLDWQQAQRQLLSSKLDELAAHLYAIYQAPTRDQDAIKAAEQEARRLTACLIHVERKIAGRC